MEKKVDQQDENKNIKDSEIINDEDQQKTINITVFWVAMVLLFCFLAGSYWLWFQQKTVNSQLAKQITELVPPVVDTSAIEQSINKVQQQMTTLKSEQTSLTDKLTALSESQKMTKGDVQYYWAKAEIKYLLNVANQRILLAHDTAGATEALTLADSQIEDLNDYRLHPLRALISEELLALSAVKKVDVEGMTLQLESALQGVDDLQVINAAPVNQNKKETELKGNNWQGTLDQAWQEVKSLVVIRHQQDGAAAVLVPEQRYFLYQNLRLKLETAQFALLTGQASVFNESLTSAKQWLEQYFIGDKRDAMLALVSELNSTNIESTLPDISASLTWLRGFEQ